MVVLRDGVVEVHRGLRDEVEDGGRIDRDAHGLVGGGVDFRGGQAAEVAEAVTHATADGDHQFDVAEAVLVTDEVRVVGGELLEVVRQKAADVTIINDHADLDRLADLVDVLSDAVLVGLGQVMRKQEDTLGAEAFGFLRILNRHAGRTAGTGEDRHEAVARINRGLDNGRVFLRLEGEEFTRAPCGEERGRAVGREPLQSLGVARGVEVTVGLEVGDREGEQSGGEDLLEFEGGHGTKEG